MKKAGISRGWMITIAMAALLVPAAGAQMGQSAAKEVIAAQTYVSLQPIPRGRTFEAAVVAHIKPTFHINAHKVLDEFLIPTELKGHLPAGFRILSTNYPPGELRQFSFSPKKLAVYTGQAIVRMKIEALSGAPLGSRDLPFSLHYQACNDTYCLPPVTVPVSLHLTVAKAGSAAKPVHSEIFRH